MERACLSTVHLQRIQLEAQALINGLFDAARQHFRGSLQFNRPTRGFQPTTRR